MSIQVNQYVDEQEVEEKASQFLSQEEKEEAFHSEVNQLVKEIQQHEKLGKWIKGHYDYDDRHWLTCESQELKWFARMLDRIVENSDDIRFARVDPNIPENGINIRFTG
jgi:hypothetical protein